ncbi:MAG: hypothetical protein K0Q63_1532, partial [Paenibacillus sp.]|nr:hypothetical protein [Paenibacillus sp.]
MPAFAASGVMLFEGLAYMASVAGTLYWWNRFISIDCMYSDCAGLTFCSAAFSIGNAFFEEYAVGDIAAGEKFADNGATLFAVSGDTFVDSGATLFVLSGDTFVDSGATLFVLSGDTFV